jgi:hypothetical protein
MISRTYSSKESVATPAAGGRSGFFNFRNVVLASTSVEAQQHPERSKEPGAWRDNNVACSQKGHAAPLSLQPAWLKKRYFLLFSSFLLLVYSTQLMAKNDIHRGNWTPPIEPPGSVIVTSLSESSTNPMSVHSASDNPQRQTITSQAATAARQPSPPIQAHGSDTALRHAIQQWSQAWGEQSIPQYLSMYASDFAPPKGLSRSAWVKQRTQRIASKKSIRHEIQNLTIQIHANQATVRFKQIYQDERLRARDRKTMHWVWRNGQWQITRESTD